MLMLARREGMNMGRRGRKLQPREKVRGLEVARKGVEAEKQRELEVGLLRGWRRREEK